MQSERIKTVLADLNKAIEYLYSNCYFLSAKSAIAADYNSTSLVNESFGGKARMDSAANTATMLGMTTHGVSNINSLSYAQKEWTYSEIQNQQLKEYHSIRDRILRDNGTNGSSFKSEEYRAAALESISNAISNIIIGRFQLPFEMPAINKFCDNARLSNPYSNSINWPIQA